jgi:hypothetical protein
MPIFQVILEGFFTFSDADRASALPAGFFTTRHVEAESEKEAIGLAKENALEELSEDLGHLSLNDVAFDVDSCKRLSQPLPKVINRGFTFYSEP